MTPCAEIQLLKIFLTHRNQKKNPQPEKSQVLYIMWGVGVIYDVKNIILFVYW